MAAGTDRPEAPVPAPLAKISTAIVQELRSTTGRGPTKARTILDGDVVVCVLADTMTMAERTLVSSGKSEEVLRLRRLMQQAMQEAITEKVEQALDRKVIAFMSENHIDPDLAVEIFILEPESA